MSTDNEQSSYNDKRRYPRFEYQQTVNFRVGGDKEIHRARTINIGGGGLCLYSRHKLQNGEKIQVEFNISGVVGPIIATAEVMWVCNAKDGPFDDSYLSGICFDRIPENKREDIAVYVEKRMRAIKLREEMEVKEQVARKDAESLTPILVVDDDPDILNLLKDFLSEKYNVLTADNGFEALELAIQKKPEVIFLDIRMPLIDGFSVLLMLKDHEETRTIPVVILSALREKSFVIKACQEGARGYITKPFDHESIIKKIREFVAESDEAIPEDCI